MLTILKFCAKVSISIDFVNYFSIYFKNKKTTLKISKMAFLSFQAQSQFSVFDTEDLN